MELTGVQISICKNFIISIIAIPIIFLTVDFSKALAFTVLYCFLYYLLSSVMIQVEIYKLSLKKELSETEKQKLGIKIHTMQRKRNQLLFWIMLVGLIIATLNLLFFNSKILVVMTSIYGAFTLSCLIKQYLI